jgi:hypothetical protein
VTTHSIQVLATAAAGVFLLGAAPPAPNPKPAYAEGQVWEYRTRPSEEDSRLKIQKIENLPELAAKGPVYHVSVTRVHLGAGMAGELPHLPVSRQTLDASVTRLSDSRPDFPSPEEGIAEWRKDKGGVFTIPLAQIMDVVERTIAQAQAQAR